MVVMDTMNNLRKDKKKRIFSLLKATKKLKA